MSVSPSIAKSEPIELSLPSLVPRDQDYENARLRQEIAAWQAEQYGRVLAWALGAFGPGWLPSHRHFLLDRDEEDRVRHKGERATAAATVYSVKDDSGRKRHFTMAEGRIVEHQSMEVGFGDMLLEPHPTRGCEHRGVWCRIHRYSLCFAPYELYHPKTAEQLAALRLSRERNRAERAERQWATENPLLAWAGLGKEYSPPSVEE